MLILISLDHHVEFFNEPVFNINSIKIFGLAKKAVIFKSSLPSDSSMAFQDLNIMDVILFVSHDGLRPKAPKIKAPEKNIYVI